jgi:hypothetical protein
MLSRLLVPLQYLYLCWRAEKLAEKAGTVGPGHVRAMERAEAAAAGVETLQIRFQEVTDWVDAKRHRDAMRAQLSA